MMNLVKRSFTIQGHRTSVALEVEFWDALDRAAATRAMATSALVTMIDEARATPLASAIRVWVLNDCLERLRRAGA